ncbi:hybrid sensor histidine kinase/response regulator [Elstera cyanobacteriorum]|uniref:hybrid sensor histidine kinase/response regulator n=1 Tax=Elstera cyanobacteriorum TaxID=2022747 RepID=UPI002354F119|nr:chemotaxis protein CheW [Elstera cyanobacteriorum]MCK6444533.1 chemotaxis protein CheW [Elstera cyanobacteriorum]
MDDLLSEFLTETAENLSVLDVELVKLEQNPNDPNLLSNIFRLVHTIKGTCGFLGLPRLESVAHAAENVLGRVRDGELVVSAGTVSLILQSLDCIKGILAVLEATEAEPPGDDSDLIAKLNAVAGGASADEIVGIAPAAPAPAPVAVAPPPPPPPAASAPVPAAPAPVPAAPAPTPEPSREVARVEAPQPPAEIHDEPEAPRAAPAAASAAQSVDAIKESAVAAQTIRVSVDLLENLMTMVSELVLTRNQLLQIVRRYKDSEFAVPLQRLSHVTSELQEGVMKTRMQPIGNAWAKLPRMVRDLSLELGKKIDLQMIGAETELDRQVLELIKDPLTHMVRNSADHGLEGPDERLRAGKSETGRITLNAYHEGGHILIEISDDGRGLNTEKIKAKIIQNGLATESELEGMADAQIYQFIFKPGFSTAAQVTAVSGRGVGMDVVRTNIEKIGGTIELKSKFGRGSTFVIKIPLTLAIVSALIVESCGERFAIPQISVVELVRASADSEHRIERIHGTPVLRLRNRLLPLVSLERLLRLDRTEGDTTTESFIIVAQVGTYNFGIMVDRVFDTEEIVVKPVAPILRHLSLFSGNTILGDGSVIMILDPNGIAASTGEMTVSETAQVDAAASRDSHDQERTTLLIFRAGDGGPKAVPLSLVARLEEIDLETVEFSHDRPMVQYRDKLMPLIPIVPGMKMQRTGRQPVLVFADGEHSMGLVVDEIVDIVEDRLAVELAADRPGFIGSAIIAGRATDVIDTGYFLLQAFGDWFHAGRDKLLSDGRSAMKRVLLVDDSPFFRNLLIPILSVNGFSVTSADSADDAMTLVETGEKFDVIVSDIEMPGMNGFEFAKAISASKWAGTPMVALSSHTAPADLEKAREVGFLDYVPKFDRDALIHTLNHLLTTEKVA